MWIGSVCARGTCPVELDWRESLIAKEPDWESVPGNTLKRFYTLQGGVSQYSSQDYVTGWIASTEETLQRPNIKENKMNFDWNSIPAKYNYAGRNSVGNCFAFVTMPKIMGEGSLGYTPLKEGDYCCIANTLGSFCVEQRPSIDWDAIPSHIVTIAKNRDGVVCGTTDTLLPTRRETDWRCHENHRWVKLDQIELPYPWKESVQQRSIPVDWSKAPKWATHAAMDSNGAWYWYGAEPMLLSRRWDTSGEVSLVSFQHPKAQDWMTSLCERPYKYDWSLVPSWAKYVYRDRCYRYHPLTNGYDNKPFSFVPPEYRPREEFLERPKNS